MNIEEAREKADFLTWKFSDETFCPEIGGRCSNMCVCLKKSVPVLAPPPKNWDSAEPPPTDYYPSQPECRNIKIIKTTE